MVMTRFAGLFTVQAALRMRAEQDNLPPTALLKGTQAALRELDAGRSTAIAVSEGYRAMRPQNVAHDPAGAA